MLLSVRLFVSERVISLCCKELLDDLDGEKEGVCSFDVTLCVSVRVCVCEGVNRPVCVSMLVCVRVSFLAEYPVPAPPRLLFEPTHTLTHIHVAIFI